MRRFVTKRFEEENCPNLDLVDFDSPFEKVLLRFFRHSLLPTITEGDLIILLIVLVNDIV